MSPARSAALPPPQPGFRDRITTAVAKLLEGLTTFYTTALGLDSYRGNGPGWTTALGRGALGLVTSGSDAPNSVAIGAEALGDVTYSSGNIAIGVRAMFEGGQDTVAIGNSSPSSQTPLNYSVLVGANTDSSADKAVVIGSGATVAGVRGVAVGYSSLADGADSVVVGNGLSDRFPGDIVLGSSGHNWFLGRITAGAVALDTANYVEVVIDGVTVKLLIAT